MCLSVGRTALQLLVLSHTRTHCSLILVLTRLTCLQEFHALHLICQAGSLVWELPPTLRCRATVPQFLRKLLDRRLVRSPYPLPPPPAVFVLLVACLLPGLIFLFFLFAIFLILCAYSLTASWLTLVFTVSVSGSTADQRGTAPRYQDVGKFCGLNGFCNCISSLLSEVPGKVYANELLRLRAKYQARPFITMEELAVGVPQYTSFFIKKISHGQLNRGDCKGALFWQGLVFGKRFLLQIAEHIFALDLAAPTTQHFLEDSELGTFRQPFLQDFTQARELYLATLKVDIRAIWQVWEVSLKPKRLKRKQHQANLELAMSEP